MSVIIMHYIFTYEIIPGLLFVAATVTCFCEQMSEKVLQDNEGEVGMGTEMIDSS